MFNKVLVANRGEIALRVIRACREMGIRTVAVYSEADRDSPAVQLADESYCIGPPASVKSYLNIPNIISAALLCGADAIHPGYGYLAERADFAEICESHGITFIGPPSRAIEQMGDKAEARRRMQEAGVPVLPGSDGPVSDGDALEVARRIHFPVMIKAVAGGGGRGMRVAHSLEELARLLPAARTEAESAFGSGEIYIEQLLTGSRHVEIQILADQTGHAIHLGERECSIQRRHQKLIEEAPSPAVDDRLRRRMGEAALIAARAVGYVNAGTVEFLLDPDGRFYFIEMNTRVQVEHPVTEMVTGVDLVKAQLLIAAGESLALHQNDVHLDGHAIECRINAEDPETFAPSPGPITALRLPGGPGIRIDSGVYAGYTVPPYYDPLLLKLIAWGTHRDEAVARLARALDELAIEGIRTNIPFMRRVVADTAFRRGELSTEFVQQLLNGKEAPVTPATAAASGTGHGGG